MTSSIGGPSGLKVWVLAARLPTLTAAIAPVAVGTGVAVHDDRFSLGPALAALLGALAIQVHLRRTYAPTRRADAAAG